MHSADPEAAKLRYTHEKSHNLQCYSDFGNCDYHFHIVCKEYNCSIWSSKINGTCTKVVKEWPFWII